MRWLFGIFLFISSSALAAPEYVDAFHNGTKSICVEGLTGAQFEALWDEAIAELEFAGYTRQTRGAQGNGVFSDGTNEVFMARSSDSPCAQYMNPPQPEIPAFEEYK